MYKKEWLVILFSLITLSLRAQQPVVHTDEKITNPSAGVYETFYCDGIVKHLWVDSTAGYTSYLWSNGNTSPSVSIPTFMNMPQEDTLTITVGLALGGMATSEIHLIPSVIFPVMSMMSPASTNPCAGPMDFNVIDHQLDSALTFNNGFSLFAPLNSYCQPVNFSLNTTPYPTGIRYLTNGCELPLSPMFFVIFQAQITPTITQNGNTYTANHPMAGGPQMSTFHWKDMTGTDVATGSTYSPNPNDVFYCVLENKYLESLGQIGMTCFAGGQQSCFSDPSDTITHTVIGMQDMAHQGSSLFPNPAHQRFEITGLAPEVMAVEVIDLHGRRVAMLSREAMGFDASQLITGMYWVRWQQDETMQQARLAIAR